ncbi:hypothetical protein HanIR_Chr15g0770951 [Helianthus annuus]|nr:hypothetical protein HanIR_Chr15g0770951 [Helianthus annuus]
MFYFSHVVQKGFTIAILVNWVNLSIFSVNEKGNSVILYVILLTRRVIPPYKMTELSFSLTEKMDEVRLVD